MLGNDVKNTSAPKSRQVRDDSKALSKLSYSATFMKDWDGHEAIPCRRSGRFGSRPKRPT